MNLIKNIFHKLINGLKYIFLFITSLFTTEKKKEVINKKEPTKIKENKIKETKKIDVTSNPTTLPDEPLETSSDSNNTNNKILSNDHKPIPSIIKITTNEESEEIETILNKLIDEVLENIYEKQELKISKLDKEDTKVLNEYKEKLIPKLVPKVIDIDKSNKKEIKEIIKPIIKEELIKKPLNIKSLPILVKPTPYVIVNKVNKPLNINKETKIKPSKEALITNIPNTTKPNEVLLNAPITMVKLSDKPLTPTFKERVKETVIASTIVAAGAATEIIKAKPVPKEIKKEQPVTKEEIIEKVNHMDAKELKAAIAHKIEELDKEEKKEKQKDKKEQKTKDKKEQKQEPQKAEEPIDKEKQKDKNEITINDKDIDAIHEITDMTIDNANYEISKEEFEDKNYDRLLIQVDNMIESLTNTLLVYHETLSDKQRHKLMTEQNKLCDLRENISAHKEQDIKNEIALADESITESERAGLLEHLKIMEEKNKKKASKELLANLDELEGKSREQIKDVDKRIMLKRFRKSNKLLEVASILAFPFVRSKYFLMFTVGLIIDNHFNFISSFLNRKASTYVPYDLSEIKKGQDALTGAIEITYKSIVELDYLEEQALTKYPELQFDEEFTKEIIALRIKLNNKYNRLTKKSITLDKYYNKTKRQIKILKKEKVKEEAA